MRTHRVNYDDIAQRYDEPLRDHDIDPNLIDFLEASPALSEEARILDVGCGTGKQLAANRTRFARMCMVGVVPFIEMVRVARIKMFDGHLGQGDGTALPFASATFHYATNQFSYSHVGE